MHKFSTCIRTSPASNSEGDLTENNSQRAICQRAGSPVHAASCNVCDRSYDGEVWRSTADR